MNSDFPCVSSCLVDIVTIFNWFTLAQNDQTVVRQIREILAEDLEEFFFLFFLDIFFIKFNNAVDNSWKQAKRVR